MKNVSVLQTRTAKDYSDLITSQSLTALGLSNQTTIGNMVKMLYRANHLVGISDFLEKIGATEEVERHEDKWITWKLQGSSMKTVTLSRATDIAGTAFTTASTAGIAKSDFYMYFDEKYFSDVHMIVGEKGSKYQLQIQEDPIQSGTEWRYRVKLLGADTKKFVPYEQLTGGKQFSVDGAPVEQTLSKKGANFNYTSPFEFRNTFSKLRFQELLPSNMKNRAMTATLAVDGKKFTVWTDYADWERRKQIKLYYDRMINYGRINTDASGRVLDKGKSGFELVMGAGLEEQLEMGNKYSYTKPSIEFLEQAVMDLSDNTKGFSEKRNVLVRTGKWGATEIYKQIEAKATAFTALQSDKFIGKGKDGGFSLDTTFTQFTTRTGDTITFMVDNSFDDKADARSSIPMSAAVPGLPGPALSYTYQIMDLGSEGNQNIKLLTVKGTGFKTYYKAGFESDMGAMLQKEGYAITMNDAGCEYHYSTPEFAVKVEDPTRTLTMKPSILE